MSTPTPTPSSGLPSAVRALLVRVGDHHFALDTRVTRGVSQPERITLIPRATRPLLGLITVRSQAVPLVDLAGLLGLSEGSGEVGAAGRVVVTEVDGHAFALTIDDAPGFVNLPEAAWAGSEPTAPETLTESGVAVTPLRPRALLDLIAERVRIA